MSKPIPKKILLPLLKLTKVAKEIENGATPVNILNSAISYHTKPDISFNNNFNLFPIVLDSKGCPCKDAILVCDSPRDIIQIKFLFPQGLPINCKFRVIGFIKKWYRRLLNINSNVHKKHNLRPHHALDDAIVNRIIFEGK